MKIPENVAPDDDFEIRCRKLGHQIHFSYCRREDSGQPCFKIIDCWYPYFPVEELLRGELTEEEWQSVFARPRLPKILSLVELIEQARKRTQEKVKGKDRKK
ncbi:MAG: hypothetical protein ABFS18_07420 [Thermodesulfobacteriota bacterium]